MRLHISVACSGIPFCRSVTETAGSYSEALSIIGEYVNITSVDDGQGYGGDMEMEL